MICGRQTTETWFRFRSMTSYAQWMKYRNPVIWWAASGASDFEAQELKKQRLNRSKIYPISTFNTKMGSTDENIHLVKAN